MYTNIFICTVTVIRDMDTIHLFVLWYKEYEHNTLIGAVVYGCKFNETHEAKIRVAKIILVHI